MTYQQHMLPKDSTTTNDLLDFFPEREISNPRQINFVVDTKVEEEQKVYLVELDMNVEARVGDLLEANDSRTNRTYLMMVTDINYAYPHRAEHAEMLDLLRRRPDKEVDDSTFCALCKNLAVCTLLGEIVNQDDRKVLAKENQKDINKEIIERGYRPSKYTTTVIRASQDTETIMASDWQKGVIIGYLRVGREKRDNVSVNFSTSELVGKRVLIVGQTGKGKSTLMRQLLDGHLRNMVSNQEKRKVGYLVDDFKMEYSFDITNQAGKNVSGLVTKLGKVAKEKLVILTCNPNLYSQHKDKVKDIIKLQIPLETLSLSVFCDLANLTEAQTNVVRLVEDSGRTTSAHFFEDVLAVDEYGMPDVLLWGKKYGPVFYSDKGKEKVKKGQEIEAEGDIDNNLRGRLQYIRRAVLRLLNMPFITETKNKGDCTDKLLKYLKEGCTVIVDKNHLEDHQQEMLTVLLLYQLFRHNQKLASGNEEERAKMIPVVVAVEEAQYLLSKDKVADPESIFAKIAFTGRSYQIGLLAITQRPQAIQKELLGQFDGFFVLPLEHANDFRHLADACPALSGYRNDLASAPVGGAVLAYGSPKKVVSVQIKNYVIEED